MPRTVFVSVVVLRLDTSSIRQVTWAVFPCLTFGNPSNLLTSPLSGVVPQFTASSYPD